MEIELKKINDSDLNFLINLRNLTMFDQLKKAGIKLSEQENLLRVKSYFENTFIILLSDTKVGMIKYIETYSRLEIIQFQILPSFQRKGIGMAVINQLCSYTGYSGKELKLKVLKGNPAKCLYEKIGFKIVGSDEHEFHMQYIAWQYFGSE